MDAAKFISARIVERLDVTSELAIFRLAPEDNAYTFLPGQYATLGVEHAGKLIERPYSVASAPHEPFLEFFIELVPHGSLTPRIFALGLGATITVRRRFTGRFILDAAKRKNHLMVATVTGIAPFISMLRAYHVASETPPPLRFTVLHGASWSQDFGPYCDELKRIEAEDDCVRYVPTVSRAQQDAGWQGEVGRVEDVLRKYADRLPLGSGELAAYLCGNPQMIENARGCLQRARIAPEQIHTEQYFPLPKA